MYKVGRSAINTAQKSSLQQIKNGIYNTRVKLRQAKKEHSSISDMDQICQAKNSA